jgi:hypothetical protein
MPPANKQLELSRATTRRRLPWRSGQDTLFSAAAQLNCALATRKGSDCHWHHAGRGSTVIGGPLPPSRRKERK